MCWNLYNCQFKASGYNHGSTYLKTRLTTNQTHTTDSQKQKKKELKHATKENHHTTKIKTKRRRNEQTTKTKFKMAISTYLPIVTLSDNGISAPIK